METGVQRRETKEVFGWADTVSLCEAVSRKTGYINHRALKLSATESGVTSQRRETKEVFGWADTVSLCEAVSRKTGYISHRALKLSATESGGTSLLLATLTCRGDYHGIRQDAKDKE